MDLGSSDLPGLDIGQPSTGEPIDARPQPSYARIDRPSGRAIAFVVLAVAALLAVFALGRSAGQQPERATGPAVPATIPTLIPTPTALPSPTPEPTPGLVDQLGEGQVLAEINFGNRSGVAIWCRETVPGTSVGSTLALLHFAESIQFGQQLIRYEELTKPSIQQSGRRGVVLETEGLGTSNSAAPDSDDPVVLGESDGSRCESCAPERVEIGGEEMLVGGCVHGIPFRAGIVYVVARPIRPGQTPLALHASCGITSIRQQGDQLVIDAEAPVIRGLNDERFPLPSIVFERDAGWLRADDLELLDWNCDVERSTQLEGGHLLRTEPTRRLSFTSFETAIGEIGLHGSTVIGLAPDQCSQLTRAWWGRPAGEPSSPRPIADLLGVEPPAGQTDWFYTCQPQ